MNLFSHTLCILNSYMKILICKVANSCHMKKVKNIIFLFRFMHGDKISSMAIKHHSNFLNFKSQFEIKYIKRLFFFSGYQSLVKRRNQRTSSCKSSSKRKGYMWWTGVGQQLEKKFSWITPDKARRKFSHMVKTVQDMKAKKATSGMLKLYGPCSQ